MANITVELKPFTVPNFVLIAEDSKSRKAGFKGGGSVPIGELDYETLSQMCEDFRAAVFEKAGKSDRHD